MEVKLTAKLTKDLFNRNNIGFNVTDSDVINFMSIFKKSITEDEINMYCRNVNCTVSVIATTSLFDFEYEKNKKYTGLTSPKLISIIDIEVDTENPNFNYQFILRTAEVELANLPVKPDIELLLIKDLNKDIKSLTVRKINQLKHILTESEDLQIDKILRSNFDLKYRLYLDNIMIIERDFPIGNLDLNESVYLTLKPGKHTIKLLKSDDSTIQIKDITINERIIEVNGDSCSFDIS